MEGLQIFIACEKCGATLKRGQVSIDGSILEIKVEPCWVCAHNYERLKAVVKDIFREDGQLKGEEK